MFVQIEIYPLRKGQEEQSRGMIIDTFDAIESLQADWDIRGVDGDAEEFIYDMTGGKMVKITHNPYGKLYNPFWILKL